MAIGAIAGGTSGLTIGLVIALVFVGGSYWFSDKLAITAARAQEVSEQEYPQYFATVRDLAQRANIPMPRLYVAPTPQPNAFATGRNPEHAAVCQRGLMQYLTWEEISGCSHTRSPTSGTGHPHQLGRRCHRDGHHVRRPDGDVGRDVRWGRNERDGGGIADLLMIFLAPVAATVIQLAVSRSREYEADALCGPAARDG